MNNKWLDPEFAQQWDIKTNGRNPIRLEQLDIVASIVADLYKEGNSIVDLGFGSGHLEEMILRRRPEAKIIGIDSSAAMINLAHKRLRTYLKSHNENYKAIQHDLAEASFCS
jgi:trans-aconitate methyltransferase